ncbi:hypothetical protein LR48_Vigan01g146200 [Vigna angularis]|uniref:tRNA/rRNA methyltransferase SpoU type domain-containing protein n=1 Tax=Phaseolus angularis TaxID=3914 RepID=A0A0L9TN55_PHAAN|nr:uncharacterized protein LOC108334623 isoform X2 [Vigna angularis]KAG2409073.1 uncharacterized protein HKW66_Vig0038950 [Vigna angularis]KOM31906.1 hypothetical protein LR48_Vigan01g146200 [Vigna angularis]
MQCASILYPQIHKIWCFKPSLSVTPPPQQQQQEEEGTSHDDKPKLITSASNPFVKHCVKLRNSSSYRRAHASALVVGATPIREICRFQESLQDESVSMDCLILPDKAEIPDGLDKSTASIVRVASTVMRKLSGLQTTDSLDAIALMKIPASFFNVDDDQKNYQKWFPSVHRILVLDGIQDPGNLGTLLRSAVAFRWDGVFLLPGCCDPFNEKALRASRGASFQIPVVSGSWNHVESLKEEFEMKLLAGHPELGELLKPVCSLSQTLCDSLSDTPLCLVLGSEGSGLSEKSLQACELVSIAMAGEYESLNVSVAGGIFLYMLQPKNR